MLESVGFDDAAREYRRPAFELFKFAAVLATENKSMDELFDAVMMARLLEKDANGEVFLWIRSIVDKWNEDSEYRKNAEELVQRWKARKQGTTFEGDIQTTHRQIHHNLLTSFGIDPTVEPWVTLIDLALKDEDPTRVLLDCAQKTVVAHPHSDPVLIRVGLEKANPKVIKCALHFYALADSALDEIDQEFKATYCGDCPDRTPRPADWTFYGGPT